MHVVCAVDFPKLLGKSFVKFHGKVLKKCDIIIECKVVFAVRQGVGSGEKRQVGPNFVDFVGRGMLHFFITVQDEWEVEKYQISVVFCFERSIKGTGSWHLKPHH